MKAKIKFSFIFVFVLFWGNIANAQIVINEIMYDIEGSDDGREWIEIWNNGNEDVDLTGWKFNDGSSHNLNEPPKNGGQGSLIIGAGSFAILSGDAELFRSEHPSFNGTVIDTVMSLGNTTDTLSLINEAEVDSATYNKEMGANGDGNSLQLVGSSWLSVSPTLGQPNSLNEEASLVEAATVSGEMSLVVETEDLMKKRILVDIGNDKNVIVGASSVFEALAVGLEKEPLQNARYVWSFGDGDTKEGENVLHNYQYPGEYVVVLNISSGKYSASDRIVVKALPADIIISNIDNEKGFLELQNNSNYELNLSWWMIKSENNYFTLPKDTIILANKKMILPSKITGLNFPDINQTFLLYPNGETVFQYGKIVANPLIKNNLGVKPPSKANLEANPTSRAEGNGILGIPEVSAESEPVKKEIVGTEYSQIEDFNKSQIAFVGGAVDGLNLFNKWTFLLMGLILISVVGILFSRKMTEEISLEEETLSADDFKIID